LETRSHHDIVVLSDLHLGSEMCRAKDVTALLRSITFDKLILLGDIFQDMNFQRLKRGHWEVLSEIRKVSDHCGVVWVVGNHDYMLADVASHLLGIETHDRYELIYYGKNVMFMHGHQFDKQYSNPFVHRLIEVYLLMQKRRWFRRFMSYLITKFQIEFGTDKEKIRKKALLYAKKHCFQIIVCGHTHKSEKWELIEKNIAYYNSGSWLEDESSYIVMNEGVVEIIKVSTPI
jgi:UDP-2,3-diacylglucosamine pyrophosphatase LpxH